MGGVRPPPSFPEFAAPQTGGCAGPDRPCDRMIDRSRRLLVHIVETIVPSLVTFAATFGARKDNASFTSMRPAAREQIGQRGLP